MGVGVSGSGWGLDWGVLGGNINKRVRLVLGIITRTIFVTF